MHPIDNLRGKKKFPSYFAGFELPRWAREQELNVFRACSTGVLDRGSFLNSYEENGFSVPSGFEATDPSVYSLSTYTKYRDVKRFMAMTSRFGIPFKIAKGKTNGDYGVCLETREWKKMLGEKSKTSHVDYWLYDGATPWLDFEMMVNDNDTIGRD